MTTDKIKRKLTAILSADVKGYSRLMGEDEEWMLPPTPPSPPITDLNGPSRVEKVEGGHKCRKKLPRRGDGRMRPVAGAAEMGAVGRFRGVVILCDSFLL